MKILIVDDSKGMRMLIKRMLQQSGYDQVDVAEASNGYEALESVKTIFPDVLFLDWNMPEMSGMELLANLKQNGNLLKFGFITSEGTPDMKKKALEAGAAFFISKPFTLESFKEALIPVLQSN